MKFVSSISGLPISAGSAAYAPTNGADVSAVASAYAESAASGKLDSTASSQFITSTDGLATTEYVDSSVSSKLDTTAFSTVSSNFLTSETITATAGDGTYVTSINGMGISGQGGGGAQVVTSTGSAQFYSAGYKTGVNAINGSAILALSATSATNASTASTAYTAFYDANGRALTSIGTATGGGSVTSPSGTILVNGSEIEGTDSAVVGGGGGSDYESGLVASDQVVSQINRYYTYSPATLDQPSIIFSSNGPSVYVTAWAGPDNQSVSTAFYDGYGTIKFTGTGVQSIAYTASSWSQFLLDVYSASGTPPYEYIGSGYVTPGASTYIAFPISDTTSDKDLIVSSESNWGAWAVTAATYDHGAVTASGTYSESATLNLGAVSQVEVTASANNDTVQSLVFYTGIHGAAGGGGEVVKLAHESAVVPWSAIEGNNGYVTAISGSSLSAQGGGVVTATAGAGGYVTGINGSGISGAGGGNAFPVTYNSGTVSAELTTGYFAATSRPSLIISSTAGGVYPRFIVTNGTNDNTNLKKGSYYLSDAFEFTTGSASNSGTKVLRVDPQQISSKNFLLYGPSGSTTYGTLALRGSNSDAYVRIGSGSVEHTNYVRPSAISSWWNVYDHVNSASASWGGSALQLSAGPGVKLDKVGNTLVASTDETVLWESADGMQLNSAVTATLSESTTSFDRVMWYHGSNNMEWGVVNTFPGSANRCELTRDSYDGVSYVIRDGQALSTTDNVTFSTVRNIRRLQFNTNGSFSLATAQSTNFKLFKVVGINRTANS